jgi:hypothetical protein
MALCALAFTGGRAEARSSAAEIEHEVHELAAGRGALWPGFDPLGIPLAIYDGSKTYVFRHPSPGSEFARIDANTAVMSGRHPAVTSNTSAEIDKVVTATLMIDRGAADKPADELAAVALHECFHVYQRSHHQSWIANEGDLLLYPTDDAHLLALRREETEALRRALATRSKTETVCWAGVALQARDKRFAAMDSAFVKYERGAELNEGLATYVQLYSRYRSVEFPKDEFTAEGVRERVYTVGPAWAYLLDRIDPLWRESLEKNDRQYLDVMLHGRVGIPDCTTAFSAEETRAFSERAQKDASSVAQGRREKRKQFDAEAGYRIIIETDAKHPLWPQQFDPSNLERVDGGLVHTRWLVLGNDWGKMEALDGDRADLTVLTEGPGPHPLFNGVTRAIVVTRDKPSVNIWGEHRVEVKAAGFSIKVEHADIDQKEQIVHIRLGK